MRVLILKGGPSNEREISLKTAQGVESAVSKLGHTYESFDLNASNLFDFMNFAKHYQPDVIFNALHGTFGEDGRVQVFLDMLEMPYTSSGVEASAVGMDKVKSRLIFQAIGLCVPSWSMVTWEKLENACPIPRPYFIKPTREGSSVGVHLIANNYDLMKAKETWAYGETFIAEPYLKGTEYTVGILDGEYLGALEIRPKVTFFDFKAKYEKGMAEKIAPATLTEDECRQLRVIAEKSFNILECRGAARADLIYTEGRFYLLEINTQPGLTEQSLLPIIAANKGIDYTMLVQKIIDGAIMHFKKDRAQKQAVAL